MTPETIAALINLGAAGAVIIVVGIFLNYIKEQNKDQREYLAERDAEWRNFFTSINKINADDICKIADTMTSIMRMVQEHDAMTREAVATMKERTAAKEPNTQSRRRPQV